MRILVIYFSHIEENYMSDGIYIGGPHYPCCMFTVLEELDFTGKIIKFFTTDEGLAIRGSNARSAKIMIEEWCK